VALSTRHPALATAAAAALGTASAAVCRCQYIGQADSSKCGPVQHYVHRVWCTFSKSVATEYKCTCSQCKPCSMRGSKQQLRMTTKARLQAGASASGKTALTCSGMTSEGCVVWQQPMYTQSPEPDLRYRPSASEGSNVLGAVRNRHTCRSHARQN
jgi:hypothetical protein